MILSFPMIEAAEEDQKILNKYIKIDLLNLILLIIIINLI